MSNEALRRLFARKDKDGFVQLPTNLIDQNEAARDTQFATIKAPFGDDSSEKIPPVSNKYNPFLPFQNTDDDHYPLKKSPPIVIDAQGNLIPPPNDNQPVDQPVDYGFGRTMDDGNQMPDPAQSPTAPATTTTNPAPAPAASKRRSQQILDQINAAKDAPITKENSFGKRLGSGLWNAFKIWGASGGVGGLPGLVGALTMGGGGFAMSPELQGEFKKEQGLGKLWTDYGQAAKAEEVQNNLDLSRARINDIPFDNALKKYQIDAQIEQKGTQQANDALKKLVSLKYFDPKNPAHAQLAKSARLNAQDLQGWDDRNPIEKQVAGITYRLNRTTGAYEQTNLPTDETKTLTDYKVKTPTGEIRTYRVSQKDAASFSTQMQALGMQIEAADKRQQNQQNWQTQEREKERQFRLQLQTNAQQYGREQTITRAVEAYKRKYFEMYAKQPSDKDIYDYQTSIGQKIDAPVDDEQ